MEGFYAAIRELRALGLPAYRNRQEKMLWDYAKAARHTIVEIGTAFGHSAILLAKATPGARVITMDPRTDEIWQKAKENIHKAGVANQIQVLNLKSEDAVIGWRDPIDLLFIDGSHEYEDVKKDFLLWSPYLVSGGAIIFDDIWLTGVAKVITEYILPNREYGKFRFVPIGTLAVTYFGERSFHCEFLHRVLWKFILKLGEAIECKEILRRPVSALLTFLGERSE